MKSLFTSSAAIAYFVAFACISEDLQASDTPFQPPSAGCQRSLQKEKNNHWTYAVGVRANSLGMVALDVYGAVGKYKQIAAWNDIKEPFKIKKGDLLQLHLPPTHSEEISNTALAQTWLGLGNRVRAQCLTAVHDDTSENSENSESSVTSAQNVQKGEQQEQQLQSQKQTGTPAPQPLATPTDDRLSSPDFVESKEPLQESLPSDDTLSQVLGNAKPGVDEEADDPLLEK